jgi:hypothetical protein
MAGRDPVEAGRLRLLTIANGSGTEQYDQDTIVRIRRGGAECCPADNAVYHAPEDLTIFYEHGLLLA